MTHSDIIGKVWSDWHIVEKIGEGSFGQVFRAEKVSYGIRQDSAIKVIRIPDNDIELKRVQSGFGLNENELRDYFYPQIEKLKKEIILMQELGEDNHIVRILDFDIVDSPDGNIAWYVLIRMEFLECLEEYVKRADLTVGDVIDIGEGILAGLEVCEANNIMHRDIKPANLFRSSKGIYKLGDFGIARNINVNDGTLSHKGTENYMAPEVYLGKKYGLNIDIYSLGIVLYKLINKNRLPFMDEEKLTAESVEKAVRKRYTGHKFPKPEQISDDLYEFLQKMCAYEPEERFQNAGEAKQALIRYKQSHINELNIPLNIKKVFEDALNNKAKDMQREKFSDNDNYVIPVSFNKTDEKIRGTSHGTGNDIVVKNNQMTSVDVIKEIPAQDSIFVEDNKNIEYTKSLYFEKKQEPLEPQAEIIPDTKNQTEISEEERLRAEIIIIKKNKLTILMLFFLIAFIVLLTIAFGTQ